MLNNYKTYLGKRGYILVKKHFPENIISEVKKELTVTPFVNEDYGAPPESFKIYAENDEKLYLPKYYGFEKFPKY